jgi:hypothetical protein
MDITNPFFIAAAVGAVFGLFLSVIFGIYNKPTADVFARSIFGVSTNSFLNLMTVSMLIIYICILGAMAFVVKDGGYPIEHPIAFSIETIVVALVPALLYVGIAWGRGGSLSNITLWKHFSAIFFKFAVTSVLLQYSGYYRYFFPAKLA